MKPVELFVSYSHFDESLRVDFENHLKPMVRQGIVRFWRDRCLRPGDDWKGHIDAAIDRAHIIILLVSSEFLASEYCYDIEFKRALERHSGGDARIVPIILKPSDWQNTPIGELQALPRDGKPINTWRSRALGFANVAQGIRSLVTDLRSTSSDLSEAPTFSSASLGIACPSTTSVALETLADDIELTLDKDYDSYSTAEQNRLLQAIKELLHLDRNIRVVRRRKGSVKLTLRLLPQEAEQLLWAIENGALDDYQVVDATVVSDMPGRRKPRKTLKCFPVVDAAVASNMRRGRKPRKTLKCFVSSPFSATLNRLGDLLNNEVSAKVLEATASDPVFAHNYHIKWLRLDGSPFSRSTIHQNFSTALRASHLCIADVTAEFVHAGEAPRYKSKCPSPSVMHEIGFAHGLDVPVFLIGEHGSRDGLPANLEGTLVSEYDKRVLEPDGGDVNQLAEIARFTDHLANTIVQHIRNVGSPRPPGEFRVEGYKQRRRVDLPYMMRNARYRIYILTSNLDYVVSKLLGSIEYAIRCHKEAFDGTAFDDECATPVNPSFKVDIQTMDPESVVTNARAQQINIDVAQYRDSLRCFLRIARDFASAHKDDVAVEVGTYVTLPTVILFIIDDTVVLSAPFPATQSRLTPHFLIENDESAVQQFVSYFFSVKSHSTQQAFL